MVTWLVVERSSRHRNRARQAFVDLGPKHTPLLPKQTKRTSKVTEGDGGLAAAAAAAVDPLLLPSSSFAAMRIALDCFNLATLSAFAFPEVVPVVCSVSTVSSR